GGYNLLTISGDELISSYRLQEYQRISVGLGGVLGLRFKLNERLSLGTEGSLQAKLNMVDRNTFYFNGAETRNKFKDAELNFVNVGTIYLLIRF
ncbi:MAG: hypothetical protein JKY54_12855, partial [Flavobacteriales bacterium]|nr:hypothetical protein [Flavobacteriales bacterium]